MEDEENENRFRNLREKEEVGKGNSNIGYDNHGDHLEIRSRAIYSQNTMRDTEKSGKSGYRQYFVNNFFNEKGEELSIRPTHLGGSTKNLHSGEIILNQTRLSVEPV